MEQAAIVWGPNNETTIASSAATGYTDTGLAGGN